MITKTTELSAEYVAAYRAARKAVYAKGKWDPKAIDKALKSQGFPPWYAKDKDGVSNSSRFAAARVRSKNGRKAAETRAQKAQETPAPKKRGPGRPRKVTQPSVAAEVAKELAALRKQVAKLERKAAGFEF